MNDTLQIQIEDRLSHAEPGVEVLLAEMAGGGVLRVFIDHPEGVSIDLCERVTHALADLLEDYALEVSSPGPDRPLTKPAHFRRFIGRRARLRVRDSQDPQDHAGTGTAAPGRPASGRPGRNLTGELVGATDREVTLAAADGIVAIPYADIRRCRLVEE